MDWQYEYEDDDEGCYSAIEVPASLTVNSNDSHASLAVRATVVDAAALIKSEIDAISNLLSSIDTEDAWLLLAHFQFSREKLMDALLVDELAVRRAAGVTRGPEPQPPDAGPPTFFCKIEMGEFPYSLGYALPCGHFFSDIAWRSLVLACVIDDSSDNVVFKSCCPEDGCHERLRRRVFARFLPAIAYSPSGPSIEESRESTSGASSVDESRVCDRNSAGGAPSMQRGALEPLAPIARYDQHCLRAFVAFHPDLLCCKGPGCPMVLRRPPMLCTLECPLGHRVCSARKCGAEEAHTPASCEEAMLWGDLVQKGADEAWLHGNAKRCPACHKWIERSSGCNRIICSCTTTFCYVCGRTPFELTHKYPDQAWSCNIPPADVYRGDAGTRLSFYVNRDLDAQKLTSATRDALCRVKVAHAAIEDLLGTMPHETAFMHDAAHALLAARHALRWSWAHAYFLAQDLAAVITALRAAPVVSTAKTIAAAALSTSPEPGAAVLATGARRLDDPPLESLESIAARHDALQGPLRRLRLFEARQGQLEGASERLAEVLDPVQLEADATSLRNATTAVRSAFVMGGAALRADSSMGGLHAPRVAEVALARREGGLPGLRRQTCDALLAVTRSLRALEDGEEEGGDAAL